MDTTKIADNIDGLADREFKTGGMKLSFGSIMAIFAFLVYSRRWLVRWVRNVPKDRRGRRARPWSISTSDGCYGCKGHGYR